MTNVIICTMHNDNDMENIDRRKYLALSRILALRNDGTNYSDFINKKVNKDKKFLTLSEFSSKIDDVINELFNEE